MPAKRSTGSAKRPSARREALSRTRIISAALDLADTKGDFSMRALGQKLKVDPMAIYRHFRDKEALIDATVDSALSGIEPPDPESGPPAERLRRMVLDFRAALAAHPGVALRVSTTQPTLGPHTLAVTDACLGLMRELGLDAAEATRAFLMVIRFVTGVAGAEERVRADCETEEAWREQMRAGYASVSPEENPNIALMANEVGRLGFQEDFEYGLDLILEGLSRRGRKKREEAAASGSAGSASS
jgi:AcrR family transcriptional regulator